MSSLIFYGAGKNAESNYKEWVKQGLKPVCFADEDKSKHGIRFLSNVIGGLPVLSLAEAIEMYPDYELFITVDDLENFIFAKN